MNGKKEKEKETTTAVQNIKQKAVLFTDLGENNRKTNYYQFPTVFLLILPWFPSNCKKNSKNADRKSDKFFYSCF